MHDLVVQRHALNSCEKYVQQLFVKRLFYIFRNSR